MRLLMVSCFHRHEWFTFFVHSLGERQIKREWYFIHIYDLIWSDRILCDFCLNELSEVWNFFLVVGRELLTQSRPCPDGQVILSDKSETPWWSTTKIFNIHLVGDCFGFESDLHGGNPSTVCSLGVHPVPKNFFKFGPQALFSSKSFCRVVALRQFIMLPSPTSYRWFIDSKLMGSSSVSPLWQPDRSPLTWMQHQMHFVVCSPWWGCLLNVV